MNTLNGLDTRYIAILGLAAFGLVVAAPVHAAPDFTGDTFIVAKRERSDEVRQDQRDVRRDDGRAPRREGGREAGRDEPQGYGYGYERRQQQRNEEGGRPRGRR